MKSNEWIQILSLYIYILMYVIFATDCMRNTEKKIVWNYCTDHYVYLFSLCLSVIHRYNLNSVLLCHQKHSPPQQMRASLCKLRRAWMWHADVMLKINVRRTLMCGRNPELGHHYPETSDLHITIRYTHIYSTYTAWLQR